MKRDVVVLFVSRALASLAQAVAVLLLARLTAPELYGTVSSLLGAGLFLTAVLDLGMGSYLLRIRAMDELAHLVRPAFLVNSLTSIALFLAVSLVGLLLLPAPLPAVLLALWIAGDKYVDTALAVPIADGRVWSVGLVLVLRRTVAIAAYFALLPTGMGALLAFALGQLAGLAVGVGFVQARVAPGGAWTAFRGLGSLVAEGRWFWLASLSAQASTLDSPLVALLNGPAVAGFYSVGGRLTRPFVLLSGALSTVLVPAAARSRPGFARTITQRILVGALALAVVGVAVSPAMPFVIALTAGRAYLPGTLAADVLIASMPFVALASPLGSVLSGRGQARFVALNGVAFGLVTIGAIALGAVLGQAVGAALGLGLAALAKFAVLCRRAWTADATPLPKD